MNFEEEYSLNEPNRTCAILTLDTFSVYNYQSNEIVHQIEFIQNKDNHVISMSYSRKYEVKREGFISDNREIALFCVQRKWNNNNSYKISQEMQSVCL